MVDGRGQGDLLPAAGGATGHGDACQERAPTRPQIHDVGPGVVRSLVESDGGDPPGDVAAELDAELDGIRIVRVEVRGNGVELQRLQGQPAPEVVNDQDTSAPIALPPASFTPALMVAVYVVDALSGPSGAKCGRSGGRVIAHGRRNHCARGVPELERRRPDTAWVHGLAEVGADARARAALIAPSPERSTSRPAAWCPARR